MLASTRSGDERVGSGVILVIEDYADMRDAMVAVLEAEGYRAIGVPTAVEALARLRARELKPSLIILDLMMPAMNGWQFRAEQVRDERLATIPVILLSAFPHTLNVIQTGSMSAAAALLKPVGARELLAVVAQCCRKDAPAASRPASRSASSSSDHTSATPAPLPATSRPRPPAPPPITPASGTPSVQFPSVRGTDSRTPARR